MFLRPEPAPYAGLVFHVLAHVSQGAHLPASVFDPVWVAFAERHLGPASERTLAEDALALGRLALDHRTLAEVGLLAWLFREPERAGRAATLGVGVLGADDVDAPELLGPLIRSGPAAELLLLAAELERPFFAKLPVIAPDWAALGRAFAEATGVAPELDRCSIAFVPSLRLRGRVRGSEIWVGTPTPELGLGLAHVVWQAAHEATVREVGLTVQASERRIEHMAVVLLALRAERSGRAEPHSEWLAHFGANAPPTALGSLDEAEQRSVSQLFGG